MEDLMRISRVIFCLALFTCLTSLAWAADVTGKWAAQAENGPNWVFNLKSDGGKVSGTMQGNDGKDHAINEGKLEGSDISFSVDSEWQGNPITLVFKGKVSGDEMQLRVDTKDGSWGTDLVAKRAAGK
jgi:autotransporter translocation and assembly factor TamB